MDESFKDFENWDRLKRKIDIVIREIFLKERELWWCSVGVNVGREVDGKNEKFERPVLVLKIITKDLFLGIPQTTQCKEGYFTFKYKSKYGYRWLLISQLRVLSTKRLIRKIDVLPEEIFDQVKFRCINFLYKKRSPAL